MKNTISEKHSIDRAEYVEIEGNTSNVGVLTRTFPAGFRKETKAVISLALPIVLTELTQFTLAPIALIFCGHLGKIELDAVAIASSLINVTGLSIILGFASACDTLFAQTYGSHQRKNLGIVLQKSILILLLTLCPCWAIHLNAEALLLAIGQHPEVSRLAGEYLLTFMPGLLCFSLYIPLLKYIQCQNVVLPNMLVGLVANGVSALFNYLFVYVFPFDTVTNGSAVGQAMGYFCFLVGTIIYIGVSGVYKETWSQWSVACLENWGSFLYLSLFGMTMLCVEWWSFEVAIFLAGLLGTTDLGAQTIVFQISALVYMVPLGVGIASSIRVGQYLGAGNADGAKTAARVAYVIILTTATTMMILVASLRNYLPMIFTNVSEVIELAATVLPLVALFMLFDGAGGVGLGILRGMGRQPLGALVITIGYSLALACGVPTMLLSDLGILGYWICLAVTIFVNGSVIFFIINCTKWERQVELAYERTRGTSKIDKRLDESQSLLETKTTPSNWLYFKRFLAGFLSILILAVGLTFRMTSAVNGIPSNKDLSNTTSVYNETNIRITSSPGFL